MIIITGPTSSGKSTTLCAVVNAIKPHVGNVVSVEDPVEYDIAGVNQISVNVKRGVTFPAALRSVLRQDPNVIYLGEIRDAETAITACQAAQTGHTVLSTLHTNDSTSAVSRLLSLGVEPTILADVLTLIVAQRLTRTVCDSCAVAHTLTDAERQEYAAQNMVLPAELRGATGCPVCGNTGFKGRTAVAEMLVIDEHLRGMIAEQRSAVEIAYYARQHGMNTMWENGLRLVADGKTVLTEIERHVPRSEPIRRASDMPASILIVDDDPVIRKILERALARTATHVLLAGDGQEGIDVFEVNRPEMVITDLNMPRLDGYGLCRYLSQLPAAEQVPFMVLTGEEGKDPECMSFELGADDFIRKPVHREALIARVRAVYRRNTRHK